jgi:putative membrane protein
MKIKKIIKPGIATIISSLLFTVFCFGQGQTKLSDAEVAYAAVTANQIDIDYALIAKQRSKDSKVIKFAETMERDHKAVIAQASALAQKLGVTPENNEFSKSLMADAAKTKKSLNAKSGKAFNIAYINNEVAYHKAVIAAVEGILIPETDNEELKQLLQNVLPALKAHLMHAEMLQRNYK